MYWFRFESALCLTFVYLTFAYDYFVVLQLFGCFVELYEDNEPLHETFQGWKDVHNAWDGVTEPLRYL